MKLFSHCVTRSYTNFVFGPTSSLAAVLMGTIVRIWQFLMMSVCIRFMVAERPYVSRFLCSRLETHTNLDLLASPGVE